MTEPTLSKAPNSQAAVPIHVVHGVLSLDVGGLERLVLDLASAGVEFGNRVTIVCVEGSGVLAAQAERAGARVISLDKPTGRRPDFIAKAESLLAELSPDVVHTHQLGAAYYLGLAAHRLGVPVVHTEHGNVFARAAQWGRAIRTHLLLRRLRPAVAEFCCVSSDIAAVLTRWWAVPRAVVSVVPNGIRVEATSNGDARRRVRESLDIPIDAALVGTVGRLVEVKRQDLMIRAVARLSDRVAGLHLLLVGDGPDRAQLDALAQRLGVTDRVRFAGYQSCPEPFFDAMDVFCLTSRSEGLPVSLLEAWRAERPVVASKVGGIPAVVAHEVDGLLFDFGDESALDQALFRALTDRALAERIGQAGHRTLSAKYSIDRMFDAYDRRYRRLIAVRRGQVG